MTKAYTLHAVESDQRKPRLAVIVPVYGHSGLVFEALATLADQRSVTLLAIVIVNDGCPFVETDRVCRHFVASYPQNSFHYIRRPNGGLSAARNTGIEFILARYDSIEAIYFLDADNRLRSYAVDSMIQAMETYPEADWFYPDIQMFGLNIDAHYDGVYSGLIHTSTNISEAGSLVRRRVFEAGVRFDEQMRFGFEDWDFWLEAREGGFKGQHIRNLGFLYRKRPESMLADSSRDEVEIRSYIRRKRKSTFKPRNLLALECEEAPRFLVVLDGSRAFEATDPTSLCIDATLKEVTRAFWKWVLRPDTNFIPPFVVFTSETAYEIAVRNGLIRWIFWDLENRLSSGAIQATKLSFDADATASISEASMADYLSPDNYHFIMMDVMLLREICFDAWGLAWIGDVLHGRATIKNGLRSVSVNDLTVKRINATALQDVYRALAYFYKSEYSNAKGKKWKWAYTGVPDRHTAYATVRASAGDSVVLPWRPDGRIHVGFILSYADFGGVEKVTFNVAKTLRQSGFVPHLALFRVGNIHLPAEMAGVFETVSWVTADGLLDWSGEYYYGTALSKWSREGRRQEFIGLFCWLDAVINCQCSDAHGIMGELKRRGVLTVSYQHLVEASPGGCPGGNAMTARAFEHSYALIVAASHALLNWFIANGLPQEKIVCVENAAGYEMGIDEIERVNLRRHSDSTGFATLRVLYIGRMDSQKGIDRLCAIVRRTSGRSCQWRVVGKPVVSEDNALAELACSINIEPPVYSSTELTELYSWADVLVMPSRYEGLPLTLIEAMRLGVVVVAANSGAICEIVHNMENGLVVSQAECVDDTVRVLDRLSRDRSLLAVLSKNAAKAALMRSWAASVGPLCAYLKSRTEQHMGRLR